MSEYDRFEDARREHLLVYGEILQENGYNYKALKRGLKLLEKNPPFDRDAYVKNIGAIILSIGHLAERQISNIYWKARENPKDLSWIESLHALNSVINVDVFKFLPSDKSFEELDGDQVEIVCKKVCDAARAYAGEHLSDAMHTASVAAETYQAHLAQQTSPDDEAPCPAPN